MNLAVLWPSIYLRSFKTISNSVREIHSGQNFFGRTENISIFLPPPFQRVGGGGGGVGVGDVKGRGGRNKLITNTRVVNKFYIHVNILL